MNRLEKNFNNKVNQPRYVQMSQAHEIIGGAGGESMVGGMRRAKIVKPYFDPRGNYAIGMTPDMIVSALYALYVKKVGNFEQWSDVASAFHGGVFTQAEFAAMKEQDFWKAAEKRASTYHIDLNMLAEVRCGGRVDSAAPAAS